MSSQGATLIVGGNSFMARSFLTRFGTEGKRVVSHADIGQAGLLDGVEHLVNFALDPVYRREAYSPDHDIDLRLAERAAGTGIHYVMLSSRKAYAGSSQWGAKESDPTGGVDAYGVNKSITEKALRGLLGLENLAILRVANLMGYEFGEGRRSFMGMVLGSLKERGFVSYDMSPLVRRDFVTDDFFGEVLDRCLSGRIVGTYNVGSGVPLMAGEIALWIIEGFGSGELRITNPRVADEFVLDVSRLESDFGLKQTREDLKAYCLELGRRLRDA
ncbi:MAG: sugar nucleotide-binding protein [Armatimonadetes bacterium]|nr:sugar nucleotide-binding protein [Armatimonadota bacterium]